jgi:hypothetical protein
VKDGRIVNAKGEVVVVINDKQDLLKLQQGQIPSVPLTPEEAGLKDAPPVEGLKGRAADAQMRAPEGGDVAAKQYVGPALEGEVRLHLSPVEATYLARLLGKIKTKKKAELQLIIRFQERIGLILRNR